MCYHLVTFSEYTCGHQYPLHRQLMDCHRRICVFSSNHITDKHDCTNECILE
ncbi:hypothetical protein OBBRIDRAFT_729278 [Obba rivulosa]|uniref:Uncharacterized protein n=1 Tax=Obba rivulosa TaxID=1052685 RepID=A0A8E2AXV5_9APHY|nr:hypothetical protein OBBRIDRAFT_729278 [Obba rivulosa]